MVKTDIKIKYYFHYSISDEIKVKINFQSLSDFQIMNLIKIMNIKSHEKRIFELKDKLEGMKYSKEEDMCLFILELEMIFKEFRNLKYKILDKKTYNYLHASLNRRFNYWIKYI